MEWFPKLELPENFCCLPFLTCCAVNNVYRALLDVGYVTGSEYQTKWQNVSQVQGNVTGFHLNFAVGECAWEAAHEYRMPEEASEVS